MARAVKAKAGEGGLLLGVTEMVGVGVLEGLLVGVTEMVGVGVLEGLLLGVTEMVGVLEGELVGVLLGGSWNVGDKPVKICPF